MQLQVRRKTFTELSTTGELWILNDSVIHAVDGFKKFCYTLEPRKDQSQGKPYCIPIGTYPFDIRYSTKFHKQTPHVNQVPGFEDIEIHVGNFPRDTEGCTLVGKILGPYPNYIGQSQLAFESLMAVLTPGEIEYLEEPAVEKDLIAA